MARPAFILYGGANVIRFLLLLEIDFQLPLD
jgi:hypothetical protein